MQEHRPPLVPAVEGAVDGAPELPTTSRPQPNRQPGSREKKSLEQPRLEVQAPEVGGLLSSSERAAGGPNVPATAVRPLRLLRDAWSRGHINSHVKTWAAWDTFSDHHGLDPEAATDAELVAFTFARAQAGLAWQTCETFLWLYRTLVEGDGCLSRPAGQPASITVPATRLLADLHDDGHFEPPFRQAPLLTLGQIRALVAATAQAPVGHGFDPELVRARDQLLVVVGYLAGLRPAEWPWVDLEHIQVRGGTLKMWLPQAKTGTFQWVEVAAVDEFDVAKTVERYLEARGDGPGPLLIDGRKHGLRRMDAKAVSYRLRMVAAQAGVTAFSPYSLRRSMAAHQQLLGISDDVIRQRLRHSRQSMSYRRYVEPLLVVMGQNAAREHWLDPTVPDLAPTTLEKVRSRPDSPGRLPSLAFAAGSIDELLEGIDLAKLRVPARLAETGASSVEQGRRQLRAFGAWARDNEVADPTEPRQLDLVRWVRHRLDVAQPQTVLTDVDKLEIGLVDATGREDWPQLRGARAMAAGALDKALGDGTLEPAVRRKKSRPATAADAMKILPAALDHPGLEWAQSVVSVASRGKGCTVVGVSESAAEAVVAGRKVVWGPGDGILCPVTATRLLLDHDVTEIGPSDGGVPAVFAAARPSLEVLRDRVVLTLAHGSGARPSDLSRARIVGVREMPAGLLVVLSVEKGTRPGKRGRAAMLWAPHRDDELDPLAAWRDWVAWWPFPDGPLVPDLRAGERLAEGIVHRLPDALTGAIANDRWRAAGIDGLSFYGFRYGRAGKMHDEGFSDLEIAEALNHDHLEVTRGYIHSYDVFADIDRGRDPIVNSLQTRQEAS